METNLLSKLVSFAVSVLQYKPADTSPRFVLLEKKPSQSNQLAALTETAEGLQAILRYARRIETVIVQVQRILRQAPKPEQVAELKQKISLLDAQRAELAPIILAYNCGGGLEKRSISASLEENIPIVKSLFRLPGNNDVVIREFAIPTTPPRKAILVFTRGLIDTKDITATILMPLFQVKDLHGDILETLISSHLPNEQAIMVKEFQAVIKGVSGGYSALFVDGASGAVLLFTKGFEHRAITHPNNEQTIRGSQAAFTETLQTNISLVRLILRSRDLVAETLTLGKRSQTDCAVMYLQSVANTDLVAEVKRRLDNISADIIAAGMLEQYIEDHPWLPMPQTLSTERPDRVASNLVEGRVAILLDGDPFALVVPISLFTLFQSPEDTALKLPSGSFMRFLRWLATFVAAILPAVYIAISYYHPEALPTDLALAIAGARERIPFPAFVEVLVMELSFELIREAGTRKPGLLGETVGIVGGIILGQAVVAANLISPITVVVIAVTGLASFAIPDVRTGMTVRLSRFVYLFAALTFGLVGVASILFVLTVILCSMKSFGVPYFSPIAPKVMPGFDVVFRGPSYRQEMRPDELNAQDKRRQPPISRQWEYPGPERGKKK